MLGWEGRKDMTEVGFGWMVRLGSTKTGAMIMEVNVCELGGRMYSGQLNIVLERGLSFVQLTNR